MKRLFNMQLIFNIIIKLRHLVEGLLFKWFAPKDWESLPDLDKWEEVRNLNPAQFSWKINAYKYKSDQLSGLLDNSHPLDKPQYFFKDLPNSRDCDNWSRIWVQYYLYHGKECQEWVVTNKNHPFTKSHFVAIVKEGDNQYRLLNYERYSNVHKSAEEALNDLQGWNSGDYNSDVRMQGLYATYKPN